MFFFFCFYACTVGPISRLIVPPQCVFPAPGYTAATARLAIASLKRGAQQQQQQQHAFPAALTVADLLSPALATAAESSNATAPVATAPVATASARNTANAGDASWDPLRSAAAVLASPFISLPPVASTLPRTDALLTTPLVWRFELPREVAPVLVFINRKSGGNMGVQLMHEFTELLNPIQVWDLAEHAPEVALALFATVPRLQVVVCGGDGTVSWVLSAIDKLNRPVPVAVVPLGTGNDLAQVLGWGRKAPSVETAGLLTVLRRVSRSGICVLDRWDATVKPLAPEAFDNATASNKAGTPTTTAAKPSGATATTSPSASSRRVGLSTPLPKRKTAPRRKQSSNNNDASVDENDEQKDDSAAHKSDNKDSNNAAGAVVERKRRASDGDEGEGDDDVVLELSPGSCWQRLKTWRLVRKVSTIFPIVSPSPRGTGSSAVVVNNYLGIGLDAVIAHKFHLLRAHYPHLFTSQLFNKAWYARLGTESYFFPHAPSVLRDSGAEVFIDGVKIDLTGMEGVCLLNIKSFGGGINFWGHAETDRRHFSEPRMDDGLFELIGFRDSLHVGLIQLGLTTPLRLAQGRSAVVRTRGPLPIQVDGEPWGVKTSCEVHVTLRGQSLMMTPAEDDAAAEVAGTAAPGAATAAAPSATATLRTVLMWAQEQGVLSEQQGRVVLTEFAKKHGQVMPSNKDFYRAIPDAE